MKKIFIITAILNALVGIFSLILFLVFGGFDIYLGAGTPKCLCWIPSIFFISCGFNILSALNYLKELKKQDKSP